MINKILVLFIVVFALSVAPACSQNEPEENQEIKTQNILSIPVLDIESAHFHDSLTFLFKSLEPSADDSDQVLTLKKSLEIAEKKSMALAIARSKTEEAYYKVDEVKSNKNIIAGITGSASYSGPTPTIEFDGASMTLGSPVNWSSAFTARYLLTNFGLIEDAKKAAWLGYLNAKLTEERELAELYNSVASSYLWALETSGLYIVAKNAVELRKQQLEVAKAKYDEGVSPKYDMLTARVNFKSAEQNLYSAERAMELNKSALRNKMGLEQWEDFFVSRPVYVEFNEIAFESAVDLAYQNRIELTQMNMVVDMAKKGFDIAAQGKNPSLLLNGSYSLQSVGFGQSGYSWATALALDIPLFDGGETKAKMNQAKEVIKQSEYNLEQLRRDISLQVKDALLRINESKKKLQTAEASLDLAKEAYEVSLVRYRENVGTFLELDSATVNYMSALAALSSAYCEFERSQLNLFYSTGLLVKEVRNNVLSQNN